MCVCACECVHIGYFDDATDQSGKDDLNFTHSIKVFHLQYPKYIVTNYEEDVHKEVNSIIILGFEDILL